MPSRVPRRHSKKVQKVYQSSSPSAYRALPARIPAEIPVFMLPHNDLSTIPEEAEIHRGFFLHMTLPPHRNRFFTGLVSISNPDRMAIDQSATTAVEYRSFSCAKAIPIFARAA